MKITINNLNKTYPGGHQALRDINLEINSGMFGLLGPNGAGKTTLMKILTLLHSHTSGDIMFDGLDIKKDRRDIRSLLGYLPQDFRFFDKLKTWEFLDYAAGVSGIKTKKARTQAVDELLDKVGLFEVRERMASKLSGGMKRRLGIAQAIIGEPKVIVVDEPTTGLDPEERIRFRNILSEISNRDVIIILSTHIVGDISSTCNDVALLNKGALEFHGTPEELISKAEGHVWQANMNDMQFQSLKEKYPIISTIPNATGWDVQLVADELKGIEATRVEPNLEHAYVYFMDYYLKDRMDMNSKGII
ncbi:MAG: ABC transporter ATP-binding protein [Marinifilaceae bacterium]